MLDQAATFINQEFHASCVDHDRLDALLDQGWRHFGNHFFRYSYGIYELDVKRVIPLRIRLKDFLPSKSQRRILKKNRDLRTSIRPIKITAETESLFELHKTRFKSGIPESIYDFLSTRPDTEPCVSMELDVYESENLLAVSYFDVGLRSNSGIYAMFDPAESARGLGIFTMLKEIEHAIETGKSFYYQGYAYAGASFYDYKKRFRGSEAFDWNGNWSPLELQASGSNDVTEA